MITLDTNLYLICSMFNITRKKLDDEYAGMSLEEIMKIEAQKGNNAAAKFDTQILNDPVKLIKLFRLDDVDNKYAILSNMSEQDLEELLPYLDLQSLVMGLNFFTKDKLLALTEKLPMEQLVKLTFEMFSPEQLMYYMPERELNHFLMSTDLDRSVMEKHLMTAEPEILAKMLEATLGEPVVGAENIGQDGKINLDQQVLLNQVYMLPNDKFREAMVNMPPVHKQDFILSMTKENPKLYELFSPQAFTGIIAAKKNKEDIIKSAQVIEPEQLVKMLKELPKNLTAVVMTQIDPKMFAQILISNFKNVLTEIVAK